MTERVYMNRRPGEERIHVEIDAAELPDLLADQGTTTTAGQAMARILAEAARVLRPLETPC
ncbi:hypothetical protein ACWEP8_37230 [Streptomyces hydrogenans]